MSFNDNLNQEQEVKSDQLNASVKRFDPQIHEAEVKFSKGMMEKLTVSLNEFILQYNTRKQSTSDLDLSKAPIDLLIYPLFLNVVNGPSRIGLELPTDPSNQDKIILAKFMSAKQRRDLCKVIADFLEANKLHNKIDSQIVRQYNKFWPNCEKDFQNDLNHYGIKIDDKQYNKQALLWSRMALDKKLK